MAVLYLLVQLYIIILLNITEIGNVFALIFDGAFAPAAALGGIIGVLFKDSEEQPFQMKRVLVLLLLHMLQPKLMSQFQKGLLLY